MAHPPEADALRMCNSGRLVRPWPWKVIAMEETVNIIASFINQCGFPIACCAIMFWYLNKERESHEAEMNSLKDALNANTQILTELKTMFKIYIPMNGGSNADEVIRQS